MPQARPSLPVNEVPPLSREKRNENTVKVLREFRDILVDFIDELIDNPPAPATKMTPKERYQWMLGKIADTYGGDPFMMQAEIAILLDDTLADRIEDAMAQIRQGVQVELPMLPASAPWVNYIPGMMLGFRAWQKRFVAGHKQYGEGSGEEVLSVA